MVTEKSLSNQENSAAFGEHPSTTSYKDPACLLIFVFQKNALLSESASSVIISTTADFSGAGHASIKPTETAGI